jgi:hypothetical protein
LRVNGKSEPSRKPVLTGDRAGTIGINSSDHR